MPNKAFKKIFVVLFFLYPLLVFLAVKYFDSVMASLALSLILVARIAFLGPRNKNPLGKAFDLVLWIVLANNLLNIYFKNEVMLKLYPFVMSTAVFFIFFHSLWKKEPIIEKFARVFDRNLSDQKLKYIFKLTGVWTAWLFINSSLALYTALYSEMNVWLIYNNLIFYVISAGLVACDLIYRKLAMKQDSKFVLSRNTINERFCIDSKEVVTNSEEFLKLVGAVGDLLSAKGKRVLLNFEDSYLFAAAVFASLACQKEIIILPNTKSDVLEKFNNEFDFILKDSDLSQISKDEKTKKIEIDFDSKISFFTSGSSGVPKKAIKTFRNLYNEVLCLESTFGPGLKRGVVLGTVTHQHIYGFLFKILWPVLSQRTFASFIAEYPEQLLSSARKFESVIVVSTPAFLKRYYMPDQILNNCLAVFSSGGLLSFQAAELTKKSFLVAPFEIYGSTESGGVAFRKRLKQDQDWTTFNGVKVSVKEDGQLVVESSYFSETSLIMGDRAVLTDSGFVLLERLDDIVKIEEKRVSLSEINQKVLSTKWVKDSTVIALEENERQQTACLAVLSETGLELLKNNNMAFVCEQIRKNLQNHFEAIVVPRKFRFVESLPYNSQSKLIKEELLGYFHED